MINKCNIEFYESQTYCLAASAIIPSSYLHGLKRQCLVKLKSKLVTSFQFCMVKGSHRAQKNVKPPFQAIKYTNTVFMQLPIPQ